MTRIDAYAHVLPKSIYDKFTQVNPTQSLENIEDETHLWDIEGRLELMDAYGIDKQVITTARPPLWLGINPTDAMEVIRLAHDEMQRIVDEHPDRFIPVATFPFLDERVLEEVDRCFTELDMAGVEIFSNVEGQPIDSEEFLPFYDAVSDHDVPIWIHPQLHNWHDWIDENILHKALGWPFDTSLAIARLVFSGIMERHQELNIIGHHMAGMIPHFTPRMQLFYDGAADPTVGSWAAGSDLELSRPLAEYFERVYGDTVRSGSSVILESGHNFFGPDNLLFATDYPFGPDKGEVFIREETNAVNDMELSKEEREKIFGNNIQSLLDTS